MDPWPSYASPEEAALSGWSRTPSAQARVVAVEGDGDVRQVTVQLGVGNPAYDQDRVTVERRPDGGWQWTGSSGGGSEL